jgi:hypothetical protein
MTKELARVLSIENGFIVCSRDGEYFCGTADAVTAKVAELLARPPSPGLTVAEVRDILRSAAAPTKKSDDMHEIHNEACGCVPLSAAVVVDEEQFPNELGCGA